MVSIILPVYNVEKYIERCMESLINQSMKDIEIIVINDGSVDKSLDILNKYLEKDNRIKIINNSNKGVSYCRNIGIEVCNGNYIMFVDSDDWLDLDMVNLMFQKCEKENADLIMCTYVREFKNHSKERIFELPELTIYEGEDINNKLNRKLIGPVGKEVSNPSTLDSLGTVWGKLYKASFIKKNKFKFIDLSIIGSAEDVLFNIYILNKLNKIVIWNKPLYHYWKDNPKSLTTKYKVNLIEKWKILFEYIEYFIIENNLNEEFTEALRNRICTSALGLGLNECSKYNKSSWKIKKNNIKKFLDEEIMINAYKDFSLKHFSFCWKFFYFLNKYRFYKSTYLMLNCIEFLRCRV
ncbi:glycosyltransferase family 2 protein [Clostridium tarantellae]|uniref:Glycosyltransferase n=1 Tax=Clostridium tarantellae TaxID=39493 RepID=A0A6I1MIX5_9CLOT|nr:glycosyltransferase family A protein [Clostridium tarantellae]MPQ43060.1 glycosyltransferase [Clostridium tarantellae]